MQTHLRVLLVSAVLCLLPILFVAPSEATNAIGRVAAEPVYPAWLHANPHYPRILFMYGTWDCPSGHDVVSGQYGNGACPVWLMRSRDGGLHWTDLRPALSAVATLGIAGVPAAFESSTQGFGFTPAFFSPDGRRTYLGVSDVAGPETVQYTIPWSTDAGVHWHIGRSTLPCSSTMALGNPALSPVSGARLYAWQRGTYNTIGGVQYSTDGGRTWTHCHDLSGFANNGVKVQVFYQALGPVVADAAHLNTVYSNMYTPVDVQPNPYQAVIRSDDAGLSWSVVYSPTVSPPLQSFYVGTDPHEGQLLVGYPGGPGVPRDRLYLSRDEGNTWRAATCPGDLHGVCPAFIVDNVFGAGASYAFVGSGVYRFHGGGPAQQRLPFSAHLPFRVADLLDVSAGVRDGDPVYVLVKGTRGALRRRLWRSTDAGRTWQELLRGPFPAPRLT